MRFLMLSPLATLVAVLAVLALVVVAYLLKPGRRRVQVASFTLWAKVLRQHRRATSRWRWWISLLLAGCIALLLTLALGRPEVAGVASQSQRIVLLLDNSTSMAARTQDGATRWSHAQAQARALVAQLGGASEVLVLDSMQRAPVRGYVSPRQAWRDIGALPLQTAGLPRLGEVPIAARTRHVHWFTDGVALPPAPDDVRVHSAFEPAENIGITVFDARAHPADATRVIALIQITNAADHAVQARLDIQGPDFALTRELQLPGNGSISQSIDLSSGRAGTYHAHVSAAQDALAIDDDAYAIVPIHQLRRVLLVSPGGSRLSDSLRTLPGVQLSEVTPARYRPGNDYDVYIFDRFLPERLPDAGTLMFSAGMHASRAAQDVVVSAWDSLHPLTRGVAWGDVRLRSALLSAPESAAGQVVVSAAPLKDEAEGALILAGQDKARWIRVGFALDKSNFTLQAGFPVFLGNAIDWLVPRAQTWVRHIGTVAVPLRQADVSDALGNRVASYGDAQGTRFDAPVPAVYTLKTADRVVPVAVNVADPDYVRINRSALPRADVAADAGTQYVARQELWSVLLLFGAVLTLCEWFSFTRKVTV